MKRSEKQLPSNAKFSTSFRFIALLLDQDYVKGLRFTKVVKEINFERVWVELEGKNCSKTQSFKKCLRLTVVLMQNSALREKFNL